MKLFVFFGLPGAGKSFAAQVAEKNFGYHLYDGDTDLTDEMRTAIQNQSSITDEMRDIFFSGLIKTTTQLLQKYHNLIVHQTFIKEKYRIAFFKEFPESRFVLIQTDDKIRENRLKKRKHFPLDEQYARNMVNLFDKPEIKHAIIQNNADGEDTIREQLQKILV